MALSAKTSSLFLSHRLLYACVHFCTRCTFLFPSFQFHSIIYSVNCAVMARNAIALPHCLPATHSPYSNGNRGTRPRHTEGHVGGLTTSSPHSRTHEHIRTRIADAGGCTMCIIHSRQSCTAVPDLEGCDPPRCIRATVLNPECACRYYSGGRNRPLPAAFAAGDVRGIVSPSANGVYTCCCTR